MHSAIYAILLAALTGATPIRKDAHDIIARAPQLGGGFGLPTGGLGGSGGSLPSGLPTGLPTGGLGGGSGGGFPGLGGATPSPGGLPFPTPGAGGLPGIGGGSGGGLPGIGGGSSGGIPGIGGGSSGGIPGIGGGSSGGLPGIGGGSSGGLPGIGGGSSGGIPGIGSGSGTIPSSLPIPTLGGEPEAGPPFSSGNHRPDGPHPLASGSSGGKVNPPLESSTTHTKRQLGTGTGSGSGLGGGSIPGLSGGSSTASDVQNGKCAPVTFIFARGTSEGGNVGSVVGPPTIQALQQKLGTNNVAAQGVNYPADFSGNIPGGDTAGKQSMTDLSNQAIQKCPDTQLVLSGYSQGGIVTHDTMAQLPAATAQKVKAVVIFGDPDSKVAVKQIDASNVKIFCASGDTVCDGTAVITPAHLTYGNDADAAADFIAGKVQVSK